MTDESVATVIRYCDQLKRTYSKTDEIAQKLIAQIESEYKKGTNPPTRITKHLEIISNCSKLIQKSGRTLRESMSSIQYQKKIQAAKREEKEKKGSE